MAILSVGGEIDSFCGKCKLTLAHTIEAIVEGKIKRVHCNTCNAQHGYRGAPGEKSATARARPAGSTGRARIKASDYDTLMQGRDTSKRRLYSPRSHFGSGEVLEHVKFGLGLVTALKGPNKIEVAFPTGSRVLIHAPAP